jgi:hypothetical protein
MAMSGRSREDHHPHDPSSRKGGGGDGCARPEQGHGAGCRADPTSVPADRHRGEPLGVDNLIIRARYEELRNGRIAPCQGPCLLSSRRVRAPSITVQRGGWRGSEGADAT